MKRLIEFFFGSRNQYRLRQATAADRFLLCSMIERDEDHRGRVKPEFFYDETPGVDSYALEDEQGVVFFFRMTRAVRLDIQFHQPATNEDAERNRAGLTEGFNWLRDMLAVRGIHEVITESRVSPLQNFLMKRLGFRKAPEEFKYSIPMPTSQQSLENSLQRLQGDSRGKV